MDPDMNEEGNADYTCPRKLTEMWMQGEACGDEELILNNYKRCPICETKRKICERPRRPRPPRSVNPQYRNAFLMDFENDCLARNWCGAPPKGPNIWQNYRWARMIKSQVYPHHSDVDWQEYCEWVIGGGGDEWFFDE